MTEPSSLLYIAPQGSISQSALIDELTCKMTAAFRQAKDTGIRYRGFHICVCGAQSSNTDYILPGGHMTNSLCIHYLAWHRDEVPDRDLEIVAGFDCGEEIPTHEEMASRKGQVIRHEVEWVEREGRWGG
jgi:hypothetical protein